MLDKRVQGVVGNFVLKTDPLPVCLCGFYVTTLCMEQLSALLFWGRLEAFLHLKKHIRALYSSSSDSIPPPFLLDANSETLADIHEKSSHICFHETRVVPRWKFSTAFQFLLWFIGGMSRVFVLKFHKWAKNFVRHCPEATFIATVIRTKQVLVVFCR